MTPRRPPLPGLLAGLLAAALGALAAPGCSSPHSEPLELTPTRAAPEEPAPPPRWRLDLELRPAGEGPAELRVPLPRSDARQAIVSLLWEVPSDFRVVEEGPDRVLVARTDRVTLRIRFQRPSEPAQVSDELRRAVEALRGRTAAEFVAGAGQRGLTARLAHGVRWEGDAPPALAEWPELQVSPGEWVAVDPARAEVGLAGALRLGLAPPVARRGASPAQLLVRVDLRRGEGTPEK